MALINPHSYLDLFAGTREREREKKKKGREAEDLWGRGVGDTCLPRRRGCCLSVRGKIFVICKRFRNCGDQREWVVGRVEEIKVGRSQQINVRYMR